jgi:hypothetical protein
MEIMNICVLHLSDIERDTGSGVDREELIQWYLEQKETEFETEEDLEYERELIAKALTKLSRVSLFLIYKWFIVDLRINGALSACLTPPLYSPLVLPSSLFLYSHISLFLSLPLCLLKLLLVLSRMANVQDNYLLEIRGDVNSSLDPSNPQDETMDDETAADSNKVYYVVHPQVDLSDLSSSLPGV